MKFSKLTKYVFSWSKTTLSDIINTKTSKSSGRGPRVDYGLETRQAKRPLRTHVNFPDYRTQTMIFLVSMVQGKSHYLKKKIFFH
jgi:hypothetical protein